VADSRAARIFLTAAFMAVVFGAGLSQMAIELCKGQRPQVADLFLQAPTKANFRAFERDLETKCWFSHRLRPWVQYVQFLILKDAGDKAMPGRAGWFFYRPAVQYLVQPWSEGSRDNIFSAIVSFRDQLDERGIRLLVVPVPNKASIYPEMFARRASWAKQPVDLKTLEIISRLREYGVEVIDLSAVFSRARLGLLPGDDTKFYLSQDTHWSPEGVRLAARTVADRILELKWAQKGPVRYSLKPVTITRYGDILEMMQVPQIKRLFVPQQLNCTQVVDAESGQLYRDDPNSQILIIGDSFLRIYSRDEPGEAGFIEHLAYELGQGLTCLVNDGGASTLVRQQLSRRPALLMNKKVVIWEFVERDIRFGTEGWQYVPLPD